MCKISEIEAEVGRWWGGGRERVEGIGLWRDAGKTGGSVSRLPIHAARRTEWNGENRCSAVLRRHSSGAHTFKAQ